MKKILAATLSVMLLAGVLAACSSNTDKDGETTTTTEATTVATEAASTDETAVGDKDMTDVKKISDAAEGAGEWTMLVEVTEADRIKDFFTLDAKNYEELSVKQAGMSAAIGEIIVIKAKEGKVDDAVKDLEARKKKLVEQDAFYPEHKEIAQKAVVGKSGNYAYLLANADTAPAEKAIKAEIDKL